MGPKNAPGVAFRRAVPEWLVRTRDFRGRVVDCVEIFMAGLVFPEYPLIMCGVDAVCIGRECGDADSGEI